MCLNCKGLGNQFEVSRNKIIPDDRLSIEKGGIAPLGEMKSNWGFKQMEVIAKRYKFSLSDPIKKIPEQALEVILKGGNEKFSIASILSELPGITKLIMRVSKTSSKTNLTIQTLQESNVGPIIIWTKKGVLCVKELA